jgi:hypothetical protein
MVASFNNGMGQKMDAGGSKHWHSLEESFYASNLLYLSAVVLAKISILLFIRRLTPSQNAARLCWTFFTFLVLWGTSSLFVWLFACGLPTPWLYDSNHCINLEAFTRTTVVIDMVTDLLLVALPVHLFARLNYTGARWTIITVFSMRAFMLVPSIFRLVAFHDAFELGPKADVSWNSVPFQVWTSVAVHYSVIAASIPCVRPFLRSLESGLYDASLKMHPRLTRNSNDIEQKLQLMTLSGWSVRKGMGAGRRDGPESAPFASTQEHHLRRSKLMCSNSAKERAESPELERQFSISSEAEFSRRLHPEMFQHNTKIQSMRTYPQFGKVPVPAAVGRGSQGKKKSSCDSGRWDDISVTKETRIRFEQQGVVLQELNTRLSNH